MIFLLGVWALFAGIVALVGYSFSFPFEFNQSIEEIPFHRWQIVRVSVFLTFGYLAVRHFLFGKEKMFPIQFLDIYIKSLTVCGFFVFYTNQVEIREYYFVLFFFIFSLILHFASREKIRNYFN